MNTAESSAPTYSAFDGTRLLASGTGDTVREALRQHARTDHAVAPGPILVFDDQSGRQTELDIGPDTAGLDASTTPAPRKPGRPRLGVVAREVTLLPRHWDWLNLQPGGASVALRRLVDGARRQSPGAQDTRSARETAYAFMSAMAGNFPAFEEASRALFAGDRGTFTATTAAWPTDVRHYLTRLTQSAFEPAAAGDRQGSTE